MLRGRHERVREEVEVDERPELQERPQPRAQLFHEELRLVPCREVAALVEFVVVDELGIRTLRPAPRCLVELAGKDTHRDRDSDVLEIEEREFVLPQSRRAEEMPCSSASTA